MEKARVHGAGYEAEVEAEDQRHGGIVVQSQRLRTWPDPLDFALLAAEEPRPPGWVVDGWLPVGYATLLAGHGGAGKSQIALYLGTCIAACRPFFGLELHHRSVFYLSCEDREDVIHWRLARICDHLGIALADLDGWLHVLDLVGHDVSLFRRGGPTGSGPTTRLAVLAETIDRVGAEVVIIDGVADVFAGDENNRAEVKAFVNSLVGLIPAESGAVVLIHHVSKATANGSGLSEGYSGSTSWHNSVRARWYLRPERAEEDGDKPNGLTLELQKSNLGRASQSINIRWDESAHLFVGEIATTSEVKRREQDEDERKGILAAIAEVEASGDYVPSAMQGNRTALHVLSACKSFPETLQMTKRKAIRDRFRRHVEHLRRIGDIHVGGIRRKNRHWQEVLTLQARDGAACADASNSIPDNVNHSDAAPSASMRRIRTGGMGGARAHCPRCDDEGCGFCKSNKEAPE